MNDGILPGQVVTFIHCFSLVDLLLGKNNPNSFQLLTVTVRFSLMS